MRKIKLSGIVAPVELVNEYSIVINTIVRPTEDKVSKVIFDAVVSGEELQSAIADVLTQINAQYPLTYADEITALINTERYSGKIGYRVDTKHIDPKDGVHLIRIDSHYIHVEKL